MTTLDSKTLEYESKVLLKPELEDVQKGKYHQSRYYSTFLLTIFCNIKQF